MESLTPYVYSAFCGAALFSAVILFFRKEKNTATKSFAFLLIIFAIDTGLNAFLILKGYRNFPHLIGLSRPLFFLYGPLYYLFFAYLTGNITKVKSDHFAHFLPFLLYSFLMIPFVIKSGATKIFLFEHYVKGVAYIDFLPHFILLVKVLLFFIYSIFPFVLVMKYKKTVYEFYSTVDIKKIRILYLISGWYFVCSLILCSYLYHFFTGPSFLRPDIPPTFLYPISVMIFSTAFFAITDFSFLKCTISTSDLIFEESISEAEEKECENDEKYMKNKIPDDVAQRSLVYLKEVMENKKPFTDSNLTLVDLAEIVHIKPHHLSQLINGRLGENFYVFINTARVRFAAELMKNRDNNQKSILEIAYQSGFNSKSAFNTYFKNIFGETPSKFRKKYL